MGSLLYILDLCITTKKLRFFQKQYFSNTGTFCMQKKICLTFNTMRYIVLCGRRYSMDIQLKRGLLDVCVLAAIKSKDSYGYQIVKDIKPYVEISESTLYPILRRLENAELLSVYTVEYNGRLRKYYHITPLGLNRIEAFKEEWKEIQSIYQFVVREDANND